MNASTIQPGIQLSNGETIGAMSDIDCFRQFSFDAAMYIDAINADGLKQLAKPLNGNGHERPIYKVGKICKTILKQNAKREARQEAKASKAELIELYRKLKEEGKDLPLTKFACEEEGYVEPVDEVESDE